MAKSKLIPKRMIFEQFNLLNSMLTEQISQEKKKEICFQIERILHFVDAYGGFQYLYWMKQGSNEWRQAGKPEGFEKEQYIIGPFGAAAKFTQDESLVSADQGEYSRSYSMKAKFMQD